MRIYNSTDEMIRITAVHDSNPTRSTKGGGKVIAVKNKIRHQKFDYILGPWIHSASMEENIDPDINKPSISCGRDCYRFQGYL